MKRAAEEAPLDPKRPRASASRHALHLLVPGEAVSLLIGKGGSIIKELEAQSGCTISFAKEDDLVMGDALRQVGVYGDSLEANTTAQGLIMSSMQATCPELLGSPPKLRILVPNEDVGFLIGPKGAAIKAITEESGSFISFCKEHEMPSGSTMRAVTLAGELQAVSTAQHRLSERHDSLLQAGGSGVPVGQAQGLPPPTWQSAATWQQPQLQPQPQQQQQQLHPLQHLLTQNVQPAQPLAHRLPPLQPPATRVVPPPMRVSPPGQPPAQVLPPPASPQMVPALAAVSAAPSWQSAPRLPIGAPAPRNNGQLESSAATPTPNQDHLSMTLWIPNDSVGQFIGQKGSSIKRITEATQVFISVQKEESAISMGDLSGGLAMRPVILSGPTEAVLHAQRLAMQVLRDLPNLNMAFALVAVPGGNAEQ